MAIGESYLPRWMSWTGLPPTMCSAWRKECFVPEKRTVAYLVAPKPPAGGAQ